MRTLIRIGLLVGAGVALPCAGFAQAPGAAANATGTAPAPSAAPGAPRQGATVFDTSGAVVGTIENIENQFALLATTKSKVRLPLSSFAAGPKGPVLGMTAAQVDAAASAAAVPKPAATPPVLTPGTAVSDSSGASVGTIDSVANGLVTVVTTSKNKVRLPASGFANAPNGGVMIGMTAAQLDAAAGQAAASPATKSAGS
jgi:hypothetical protein